jgi:hypothetical protein
MMNYLKHGWIVIILLSACTLSTTNEGAGQYVIHSASDVELASIIISSDEITLRDAEGQLMGVAKRSDKRKYYSPANTMMYAVKLDEDGFKLRDGNEQMIWKVKLYEDKLKIANNEEMHNGFEVKLRDGKLKLERNEREIKSIRLTESTSWYEVDGRYKIQGFGQSLAIGILLINDLEEREKFIIMAELAKQGR